MIFAAGQPLLEAELRRRSLALVSLNSFCGHRRAALWQVEQANFPTRTTCSRGSICPAPHHDAGCGLIAEPMNPVERMQADYRTQRLTTGPHPMRLMRGHLA